MTPQIVVAPANVEDIQKLVQFVTDNKERELSLTPRAAGTDMSGASLSESILLDMTKHFNRMRDITARFAITQPGVFYHDFERHTLTHGAIMPSYPASRELCAVGGMVGNNAGGEKSLTYGMTEDYVEQIKAVLADGNEYTFKPLTRAELDEKMRDKTFEGQIYRRMFRLLDTNYDRIRKAKPNVSKNSAGYHLWNVWDRKTFNLHKLFVGSQGTLGIITEIKFRLVQMKPYRQMLVIPLYNLKGLGEIINEVLDYKPETFETYDDQTLKLAIRFLPEIGQRMKVHGVLRLLKQFWPELKQVLLGRSPKLVLLAEFTGESQEDVRERAEAAQVALRFHHVTSYLTHTQHESKKYWAVRRESFNLLRKHMHERHAAPFIDDIIVNPEHLPEFLPELQLILNEYNLTYTLAGHIGNGNFHIFPLMNFADPKTREIIPELSQRVFALVFKYKGSMSGEHNDGLIRAPFLKEMYGEEMYKLFEETKRIFDPNNIFNPGKKIGVNPDYVFAHFLRSGGS